MADKNLFASLQKIASESITGQQPANDSGNQELMTQQDIQNIKGVAELYGNASLAHLARARLVRSKIGNGDGLIFDTGHHIRLAYSCL